MIKRFFLVLSILAIGWGPAWGTLRVPAFTAYIEPDPNGASVTKAGVTKWTGHANTVNWYGHMATAGQIECTVTLCLPAGRTSKLRFSVAGQSHEVTVTGAGDVAIAAKFGGYGIAQAGYQRFTLESLNGPGEPGGDIVALLLDGPAAQNAHFNHGARRGAASVHLRYPIPAKTNIIAFYVEATGVETPLWTYVMACGWSRGYFGMQVNSATERRIIFSVWDSGHEPVDRSKVKPEDRVQLAAKGEGVYTGDFGGEGTGGHSHLVFPWKTGDKQRFLVTAKPVDATHTTYSGYYFRPDTARWMLISGWTAPQTGGGLKGLYSFSEDFGDANGQLRRKALYGNQWICDRDGHWLEITTARFTHDPTGNANRLDRFAGVEGNTFFLSQGGYIPGTTPTGETLERPANGQPPADVVAFVEALK